MVVHASFSFLGYVRKLLGLFGHRGHGGCLLHGHQDAGESIHRRPTQFGVEIEERTNVSRQRGEKEGMTRHDTTRDETSGPVPASKLVNTLQAAPYLGVDNNNHGEHDQVFARSSTPKLLIKFPERPHGSRRPSSRKSNWWTATKRTRAASAATWGRHSTGSRKMEACARRRTTRTPASGPRSRLAPPPAHPSKAPKWVLLSIL